jgi:hypothetical protein
MPCICASTFASTSSCGYATPSVTLGPSVAAPTPRPCCTFARPRLDRPHAPVPSLASLPCSFSVAHSASPSVLALIRTLSRCGVCVAVPQTLEYRCEECKHNEVRVATALTAVPKVLVGATWHRPHCIATAASRLERGAIADLVLFVSLFAWLRRRRSRCCI